MRPRNLIRRCGRRGAFLLFLALLDSGYGYSLIDAQRNRVYDLLLPYTAWGVLWSLTGLLCAASAFGTRDRAAFTAAAAINACWAALMFWIWIADHIPLGWVSGAIWTAFALTVLVVSSWPEPLPALPPIEPPSPPR